MQPTARTSRAILETTTDWVTRPLPFTLHHSGLHWLCVGPHGHSLLRLGTPTSQCSSILYRCVRSLLACRSGDSHSLRYTSDNKDINYTTLAPFHIHTPLIFPTEFQLEVRLWRYVILKMRLLAVPSM